MTEFFQALSTYTFLQNALLTGLLVSISCGIIGTYVVVRRISYLAGGIAHTVFGGIGATLYLQNVHGMTWLDPLYGAVVAAMLAALIIGTVSLRARGRADTVIGALWAVGFAAGVLFTYMTPTYNVDLMSYLFGNIMMVGASDLWLIAILDAIVAVSGLLFFNHFLAVCFDEEYAEIRGLNTHFYYLFLLCLAALTVVLLVTVVGIIMVIALLTLPAAIAGYFSRSLSQMMIISVLLTAVLTTSGLSLSYGSDLPAGATIVILTGLTYLAVLAGARAVRRVRVRLS